MIFATATSKGQITIPAAIRQRLDIKAGTRIRFIPTAKGYELRPVPVDSVKHMKGLFSGNGKKLSLDQLNEATECAAAESGLQGLNASYGMK